MKHTLSRWLNNSILDVYPIEMKNVYTQICAWIFITALFIIAKTCLSTGKWINNNRYTHILKCYSLIKTDSWKMQWLEEASRKLWSMKEGTHKLLTVWVHLHEMSRKSTETDIEMKQDSQLPGVKIRSGD